ncbi:MAG TPA: RDD family protein [Candidatus Hydrogenedentes bacterium]|nr:RDD family protein [Candidatus Hydrogenedentota bacterium]
MSSKDGIWYPDGKIIEFLPDYVKSEKVYVGFWRRFFAGVLDLLILLPVVLILVFVARSGKTWEITSSIAGLVIFTAYTIIFCYRYGGTLGDIMLGIRITRPDGSRIGWNESIARYIVPTIISTEIAAVQAYALIAIDPVVFNAAGSYERQYLVDLHTPGFQSLVDYLVLFWYLANMQTLIANRRKRSLHDFIASTVVVYWPFSEHANPDWQAASQVSER